MEQNDVVKILTGGFLTDILRVSVISLEDVHISMR